MLKVGAARRVMLSELLMPVSLASIRSGVPGAPGSTVSSRGVPADPPELAQLLLAADEGSCTPRTRPSLPSKYNRKSLALNQASSWAELSPVADDRTPSHASPVGKAIRSPTARSAMRSSPASPPETRPVSAALNSKRSLPAPPVSTSAPRPPISVSSPVPPSMELAPALPWIE